MRKRCEKELSYLPQSQGAVIAANKPLALPTPTPAPTSSSPLELLVTQAAINQAQTLGVLVSRVEALEAQLSQLQHERNRVLQQLAQAQGFLLI